MNESYTIKYQKEKQKKQTNKQTRLVLILNNSPGYNTKTLIVFVKKTIKIASTRIDATNIVSQYKRILNPQGLCFSTKIIPSSKLFGKLIK